MSDYRYDPEDSYDKYDAADEGGELLGLRFRCTSCGEECGGKYVDNGIGSYEYWGYRGRHVQKDLASDCCEKDVEEVQDLEDDEEQAQPA